MADSVLFRYCAKKPEVETVVLWLGPERPALSRQFVPNEDAALQFRPKVP